MASRQIPSQPTDLASGKARPEEHAQPSDAERARRAGGQGLRVLAHVNVIALINIGLIAIAPASCPPLRLLGASVMLWVAALPVSHFLITKPRQAPVFPLVTFAYFVYFGLPIFLDTVTIGISGVRVQSYVRYESPEITNAVGLTVVGLIVMQIAFYTPAAKLIELLPRLKLPIAEFEQRAWLFLGAAFVCLLPSSWLFLTVIDPPEELRAMVQVVRRLPVLFLSAAFMIGLRGRLSLVQQAAWVILFAVQILVMIATGNIAHAMLGMAPVFFVYVAERGRIPWRAGIVAILLIVPFLQTKFAFRREVTLRSLSGVDRITTILDVTWDAMSTDSDRFWTDASGTTIARISYIGSFAHVIRQTPTRVPFLDGETYRIMAWAFVPRIFAKDKPLQSLGQDFGHRYGFIPPQNRNTSVNCPQLIEMYMNFGTWGVVFGMVLLGCYYRGMYTMFNHSGGGDGIVLVSASTLATLLNIESDAAGVLTGGVQVAIGGYVALWFLTRFADRMSGRPSPS